MLLGCQGCWWDKGIYKLSRRQQLTEISEVVTSPSLMAPTFLMQWFSKYTRMQKALTVECVSSASNATELSSLLSPTGYSFISFSAVLTSVCADSDGECCGKICSLGNALAMLLWFALSRVEVRSYKPCLLLRGIYHSDYFFFFIKEEKEMRNWATLPPLFLYCSNLSLNLILSSWLTVIPSSNPCFLLARYILRAEKCFPVLQKQWHSI